MLGWKLFAFLLLAPGLLAAQEYPVERLRGMLPASVAEDVIAAVQDALARGLPGEAIAQLALQGVAKGRSGAEVLAAARILATELGAARNAIERSGRQPHPDEIRAATAAMRLGVDGEAVSALASSAPSGRSLMVALFVVGALVERGLPSDDALTAVRALLEAQASDADLIGTPRAAGAMLAQGLGPREVGAALAAGRIGFSVPVIGFTIPVAGPPAGVPLNGGAEGRRPIAVGRPGTRGRSGGR